ncbi:MAG: hypothetical protein QOE98_1136, partial [Gaiellaceae bacterium]|nr:hypothetical protein [Gaiellaceae bacterium]
MRMPGVDDAGGGVDAGEPIISSAGAAGSVQTASR